MWRPAVVRFGMLVVVACSGGSKTSSNDTIGNRSALSASSSDMTAHYWCSIRSGEYEYPQMRCVIEKDGGGQYVLAKLDGSQRFRGVVRPRGDGFTFDGELFCPWGDCTQPLRGVFEPTGDGRLRGTFNDMSMTVTLTRAQGGAYGGVGYGGLGYGGFGYGGAGYGGAKPTPPQPVF